MLPFLNYSEILNKFYFILNHPTYASVAEPIKILINAVNILHVKIILLMNFMFVNIHNVMIKHGWKLLHY